MRLNGDRVRRFHSWEMYHLVVRTARSRVATVLEPSEMTNVPIPFVNPLQPPSSIAAVTPARVCGSRGRWIGEES